MYFVHKHIDTGKYSGGWNSSLVHTLGTPVKRVEAHKLPTHFLIENVVYQHRNVGDMFWGYYHKDVLFVNEVDVCTLF